MTKILLLFLLFFQNELIEMKKPWKLLQNALVKFLSFFDSRFGFEFFWTFHALIAGFCDLIIGNSGPLRKEKRGGAGKDKRRLQ